MVQGGNGAAERRPFEGFALPSAGWPALGRKTLLPWLLKGLHGSPCCHCSLGCHRGTTVQMQMIPVFRWTRTCSLQPLPLSGLVCCMGAAAGMVALMQGCAGVDASWFRGMAYPLLGKEHDVAVARV